MLDVGYEYSVLHTKQHRAFRRLYKLQLNYYRLEAGRFEDFVSYGLKSFAHEGVT